MKERPILFSAAMVNAILAGRKTQTRRIIKQQPDHRHRNITLDRYVLKEYLKESGLWQLVKETKCPYGKPQDQLWVRENFKVVHADAGYQGAYSSDDFSEAVAVVEYQDGQKQRVEGLLYNAIRDSGEVDEIAQAKQAFKKRKVIPSIHMFRWASRIDLLIKNVRVERLQDISEEDAIAEGCKVLPNAPGGTCYMFEGTEYDKAKLCHSSPVTAFNQLWKDINGPDSWDANPWVWVVDFERIQPDSKQEAA